MPTKRELKEQNEALRNLLMEIRDMIDAELEAIDEEADGEDEEEEDDDEEDDYDEDDE
ncbi:MAG: hypothetical protein MUF30_03830 [Burkholderiales bacterium]|jgi:hypothetical protein|nr:hypothetical protein [Burkholderiales bacterium]